MKNSYKRLISYLPEVVPPQGLALKVVKHIELMDRRRARMRFASYAGLASTSCAGLVFASLDVIRQISNSDITYYFSLFASDRAFIFSYAKDFVFSIADSLPVVSLAVTLTLLGTFMWSLVRSAREVRFKFYQFN